VEKKLLTVPGPTRTSAARAEAECPKEQQALHYLYFGTGSPAGGSFWGARSLALERLRWV